MANKGNGIDGVASVLARIRLISTIVLDLRNGSTMRISDSSISTPLQQFLRHYFSCLIRGNLE